MGKLSIENSELSITDFIFLLAPTLHVVNTKTGQSLHRRSEPNYSDFEPKVEFCWC